MILYFLDRTGNAIGSIFSNNRSGMSLVNDAKKMSVSNGVATLSVDIMYDDAHRLEVERLAAPGNYVLRRASDSTISSKEYSTNCGSDFFVILENETRTRDHILNFYAEGCGLDLINDVVGEYKSQTTLPNHISSALSGTSFRLRDCYDDGATKYLAFSSAESVTSRLNNILSSYDECEMEFGFTISGLSVVDRWVDVYKKLGSEKETVLSINRELSDIRITRTINQLATAIIPSSRDITLQGLQYDDGDIWIDGTYLKSRTGLENWTRLTGGNDYICKSVSLSATSQAELLTKAIKYLRKVRIAEVNYEIDISILPDDVNLGDRINIVDDLGEVYISGRVLTLEISELANTRVATLGEFLNKSDGLSDIIKQLAENVKNQLPPTLILSMRKIYDATLGYVFTIDVFRSEKQLSTITDFKESLGEDVYIRWYLNETHVISNDDKFSYILGKPDDTSTNKVVAKIEKGGMG